MPGRPARPVRRDARGRGGLRWGGRRRLSHGRMPAGGRERPRRRAARTAQDGMVAALPRGHRKCPRVNGANSNSKEVSGRCDRRTGRFGTLAAWQPTLQAKRASRRIVASRIVFARLGWFQRGHGPREREAHAEEQIQAGRDRVGERGSLGSGPGDRGVTIMPRRSGIGRGSVRRRRPVWAQVSKRIRLGRTSRAPGADRPAVRLAEKLARKIRTRSADHHTGPRHLGTPHLEALKKEAHDPSPAAPRSGRPDRGAAPAYHGSRPLPDTRRRSACRRSPRSGTIRSSAKPGSPPRSPSPRSCAG